MATRELPVRASLENLRKQAKALHRAFHDGDADAVRRIHDHLPKAATLSAEELRRFDLSLQEAQHVLAKEYGRASWDDLRAAVEVPFDAFADLGKPPFQEVLRATDIEDVTRALSATTERVREAFFSSMARRVVRFVTEDIGARGPWPAAEVEAAQRRILDRTRQLAAEKGFQWPPPPMSGTFEDLARLTDRDSQVLMREVPQLDLSRALIGAPEAVRGRFLSNMSRRVRTIIVEDGERLTLDLPAHEPAASRQRVLEWANNLGREDRIAWPPTADRPPWSGDLEDAETRQPPEDPLGGRGLEDLAIDDLARIFGELTTTAKREGILGLDEAVNYRGPLGEGLRLAVDGTYPALVEAMLDTRRSTMVRNRRLRLTMMRDGVAALQAGDNPRIVWHKMQAHYLDPEEWETPQRSNEAIGGAELRDWIERGWLTTRTPAAIAELFLHLGYAARNEGVQALAEAADAIEHALLKESLAVLVADRDDAQGLQAHIEQRIEAEVAGLDARMRAITAGVLGVMAGMEAAGVTEAVRAAAAAAGAREP